MSTTTYRITGDKNDYTSEDEAIAAMREQNLGKDGRYEEERTSDGSLKVTFVETTPAGAKEKGRKSWTIKSSEPASK